jgi:hypothetical protein
MRILQHNVWIDAAVKLLHAYAEACEKRVPMSELRWHYSR